MKNVILILFLFISFHNFGLTQEEIKDGYYVIGENPKPKPEPIETFQSNPGAHGFSVGLTAEYGQIEGKHAGLAGIKIDYIIDHKFEIGLAGKAFISEYFSTNFNPREITLTGGYGGLHFAPHFFATKKIHFNLPILIGGGAVGYFNKKLSDVIEFGKEVEDWEPVMVVEPGINAVFNITRHFQIETGFAYRFTNTVELDYLEEIRLNGFSAGLALKFGIF